MQTKFVNPGSKKLVVSFSTHRPEAVAPQRDTIAHAGAKWNNEKVIWFAARRLRARWARVFYWEQIYLAGPIGWWKTSNAPSGAAQDSDKRGPPGVERKKEMRERLGVCAPLRCLPLPERAATCVRRLDQNWIQIRDRNSGFNNCTLCYTTRIITTWYTQNWKWIYGRRVQNFERPYKISLWHKKLKFITSYAILVYCIELLLI